jgi:thiol:disulfide interchange protein
MDKRAVKVGIFIVALLLVVYVVALFTMSPGGPPRAFAGMGGAEFEQAMAQSRESGRPMLVFATADWCMPCQHLKRTTLEDDRVVEAIAKRTVPVYLDLTSPARDSPEAQLAGLMNIRAYPTLVLWNERGEVGRQEGYLTAVELLSWLESF